MQILTYDIGLFKSKLQLQKIAGLGLQFGFQNKFIKKNKSTKNTSENTCVIKNAFNTPALILNTLLLRPT